MIWTDVIVPVSIVFSGGFCAYSLSSQVDFLNQIRLGATRINVSGRQRMLSQRISFLSSIDASDDCKYEVEVNLDEALEEFSNTGTTITSFCEDEDCIQLGTETSESLEMLVDSLSLTPCPLFEEATHFLQNMESLVGLIEDETNSKVDMIKFIISAVQIFGAIAVSVMTITYSVLTKKRNRKMSDKMERMVQYLFHEVRNPLNHVVNGVDHILSTDESLSALARTELEQCATGGIFIASILNDVLTLASLESKNHVFDTSPSSVPKLLVDIARITALTAFSKGTAVDTEFSEEMGSYNMDHVKVSQVLMNIVTNAVKYAGSGKKIVIGANVVSQGHLKDRVCFYVTDNGAGIAPNVQKQLFQRFKTFSRNSGSGIGLHITQVIIHKMGGAIKVISPLVGEDHGSRFEFTLALTRSTTKLHQDKKPDDLKHDVKILIADDEKINCIILERRFSSEKAVALGWTSEYVCTLREVLKKATDTNYDVILLDEHFGSGQIGSLFIDTLKKNGVKSKIFIASANCSTSDNQLYIKRGAVGTIPKPTPKIDGLLDIISSVL